MFTPNLEVLLRVMRLLPHIPSHPRSTFSTYITFNFFTRKERFDNAIVSREVAHIFLKENTMYFIVLAVDYDGSLAQQGEVRETTIEALNNVKASGRKLIMVTGRQLDDLKQIFDRLDLFDRIVAENGALMYNPQTEEQRLLVEPFPTEFSTKLQSCGIVPLSNGKVIVATLRPNETKVLEIIQEMGLELEIIFNKNSVMVLPSGINKATGLNLALKELGLTMHNVIGIGDAENDHAFLRTVGLGVAVANATEALKENALFVTKSKSSEGVEEVITQLLEDETPFLSKLQHKIILGSKEEESLILNPFDQILIAGKSAIGKSTLATMLTEKIVEKGFQFCVFDPEGDYEELENAIGIGNINTPPSIEQVMELLKDSDRNVVVNTLGIELKERPAFFLQLASKMVGLKASTGRPHWLIIDEAHHLIPKRQENISPTITKDGTILITVHPEELAIDALKTLTIILVLGVHSFDILQQISQMIEEPLPLISINALGENEVLVWDRSAKLIKSIKAEKPKQQHKRHTRKYVEGDLSEEYSFYFRGPQQALNLRAQNLTVFLQIAEGVDEATWMYHLKNNDYSKWFRTHIKDDHLAESAEHIESDSSLTATQSREAISHLVTELYIAPTSAKHF